VRAGPGRKPTVARAFRYSVSRADHCRFGIKGLVSGHRHVVVPGPVQSVLDLTLRTGRSVANVTNFWHDSVWPEEVALQYVDLSPSEWILPRLRPWGSGSGTRVGSIVPSGYPAYARVLHPARRTESDPVMTWRDVDVPWREVADWSGRTYHPLMQFGAVSTPAAGTTEPSPFDQEPSTGRLFPDECHALFSVLAERTTTPDSCWLGIWEGWGTFGYPRSMSFIGPEDPEVRRMSAELVEIAERVRRAPRFEHPGRSYLLAKSTCEVICEIGRPPLDVTPSLVWPEDRAWCVGSEIDFDSTLVAASEECVTALIAEDGLEVVRVESKDRLDIEGDVLNSL